MGKAGRNLVASVIVAVGLVVTGYASQAADRLPAQLTDQEFWSLVTEFSEPGGIFGSENFVSNERSFQTVLDELTKGRPSPSAYVGVGPEQNFTYIAALKPQIAFIVDIRRQNMVQHLMYKALFELSEDRGEFLSRLLSRPRPEGLKADASVVSLFDAFAPLQADPQRFQDTLQAIRTHLVITHGFKLTPPDETSLERVLVSFAIGGLDLTYSGPRQGVGGIYPTFEEIMQQTDQAGKHRSFLASEQNYLAVRALQKKNLLVPIVGDFSGPKALKAVGDYLRSKNATVTSFYTSNVEQYLFQTLAWRGYYANVATLPIKDSSVFIRGLIKSASGEYSPSPMLPPTSKYETVLFPISELVGAFTSGKVESYLDILVGRKVPAGAAQ